MNDEAGRREAQAAELEAELAQACGTLNMAAAAQVELIAKVLENGSYAASGVRSAEQWVAWQCGVSLAHARQLVTMARRLPELPATGAAFAAGELAEDQVAVICRHVPAHNDAEAAELARYATVSQLRRTLGRYGFPPVSRPPAGPDPEPDPDPEAPEPRRASFGFADESLWRLSALLPLDEGAVVERALALARQELIAAAEAEEDKRAVTWADALVAVAERYLASDAAARPHADRHLVHLHLEADASGRFASLHLGPFLPDALRRQLTCDAKGRIVLRHGGVPLSVGRTQRIVPDRTRVAIEHRDGGCRVPGCDRRRWLQVHHLLHWEDGGPTDTHNLVALCSKHHRLHHRGLLDISGDGDDPDGLVFTDARGRRLTGSGRPAPPHELPLTATYSHPTGERLDPSCVWFRPPPGTPPPRVVTAPLTTDVYKPRSMSFGAYMPELTTPAASGDDGDSCWGPDEELACPSEVEGAGAR